MAKRANKVIKDKLNNSNKNLGVETTFPTPFYLLDKTTIAKAIVSQKKTKMSVKRCIKASKPRAFVRSNKASDPLLSKTLLLGFF